MAEYINTSLTQPQVINGWNYKRNKGSAELSQFSPFVDIIALYKQTDPYEPITIERINDLVKSSGTENTKLNEFIRKLRWYKIFNDSSGLFVTYTEEKTGDDRVKIFKPVAPTGPGYIQGIPIASSVNRHAPGMPINSDGVGIISLSTERGASESFNMTFNVKLHFSNISIIERFLEYISMITLNSYFLINYGWIPGNNHSFQTNVSPPSVYGGTTQQSATVYDVTQQRKNSYFSSFVCKLWKYEYSFDGHGGMEATLEFMSPYMATLAMTKVVDFQQTMQKYLLDPDSVPGVEGTVNADGTPNKKGLPYVSNGNINNDPSKEWGVFYYSLRWFFAALNKSLEENGFQTISVNFEQIPPSSFEGIKQTMIQFYETAEKNIRDATDEGAKTSDTIERDREEAKSIIKAFKASERFYNNSTLRSIKIQVEHYNTTGQPEQLSENKNSKTAFGVIPTIKIPVPQTDVDKFDSRELLIEYTSGYKRSEYDFQVSRLKELDKITEENKNTNATTHNTFEIIDTSGLMVEASVLKDAFSPDSRQTLLEIIKAVTSNVAQKGVIVNVDSVDGGALNIKLASYDNFGMTVNVKALDAKESLIPRDDKIFTINYGHANSLCENISLETKMDPNAWEMYQLPISAGGNTFNLLRQMQRAKIVSQGAEGENQIRYDIQQIVTGALPNPNAKDDAAKYLEEKLNDKTKSLEQIYASIVEETKSQSKTTFKNARTSLNRLSGALEKYLQKDIKKFMIVSAFAASENSKSLFSTLLGYYLKKTVATIHGTCGLNSYEYIAIKGLFKGVSGLYSIIKIEDEIDKSGFTTKIEAMLVKPDEDSSDVNITANISSLTPIESSRNSVVEEQERRVISQNKANPVRMSP